MFPYQNHNVLDPKKCLKRQQILCQRIAMLYHFQADIPPPEKWWNQATMHWKLGERIRLVFTQISEVCVYSGSKGLELTPLEWVKWVIHN